MAAPAEWLLPKVDKSLCHGDARSCCKTLWLYNTMKAVAGDAFHSGRIGSVQTPTPSARPFFSFLLGWVPGLGSRDPRSAFPSNPARPLTCLFLWVGKKKKPGRGHPSLVSWARPSPASRLPFLVRKLPTLPTSRRVGHAHGSMTEQIARRYTGQGRVGRWHKISLSLLCTIHSRE